MNFWWGYVLGSATRGGAGGAGGVLLLFGCVWAFMEVITPAPPKEIRLEDYKGLILAAGASCTGLSVVSHHLGRPGRIMSDKLSPIQDILVDRIQHGDRSACGMPPRPATVHSTKPA
jgi:hypothetical protein